jgi:hypothetical protein
LELDLAVAENFVEVCRDGEECDKMKTKSDEDCPIDMEDKLAVDPLYSLIKPCCVRLKKLDRSDWKGTLEEATSIEVKEVDLTREISLDSLNNSHADNRSESLDEIALELEKMESSTSARSGIALDIPATKVDNSEDDEESLRMIFESCLLAGPVNRSSSNEWCRGDGSRNRGWYCRDCWWEQEVGIGERQAELEEFQTYLGQYKTGQEETSKLTTTLER